jgi:restriction system protein
MPRHQSLLGGMISDTYEAGVANPRMMGAFTLFMAACSATLNWLWQPFGPTWTPFLVLLLWVLTAVGTVGVIKGYSVRSARSDRLRSLRSLDDLKQLSWQQFEQLVADAYRAKGYRVEERGGTGDGGIDLLMRSPKGELVAVQCKRWKEWQVGAPRIREFVGALAQANVRHGVFVTSGRFSRPAKETAAKTGIHLIDGRHLLEFVNSDRG